MGDNDHRDPESGGMRIVLDINNMMVEMIGEEYGLTREELDEQEGLLRSAHERLLERREGGGLQFMDLPHDPEGTVPEIEALAAELGEWVENFVVLGIGGSALGNIALHTALKDPYHNLDPSRRGDGPRLFVPDNADPVRFASLLDMLDLEKTVFNVITKSGGTAETMSQFLIARQRVAQRLGKDRLPRHFVATTSRERGFLIAIAREEGLPLLFIPEGVGGRFSVLSPVGLLSAAVCGIDIGDLLAGARAMDARCGSGAIWENPAYMNGLLHYLAYHRGQPLSVMMPYAHQLKDFADWYRQLWAESLGKEYDRDGNRVHIGPTPIRALGATDQHSQVQLYMEGPCDKVITFLEVEDFAVDLEIPAAYRDLEGVAYLGDHTMGELITTEKRATEMALAQRGRPSVTVRVPAVNAFTLGQLFFMFEVQTAFVGELFNINAFDQPGVELGKQYTYGILGRPGFAEKAGEFASRPRRRRELIL